MLINDVAPATELPPVRATDCGRFDLEDVRATPLATRILALIIRRPLLLFAFLRRFWPIAPFASVWLVTRFDDVQEVLNHQRVFHVPYGPKVSELNGGPNFLLGMQDGDEYRLYRQFLMQAFRLEDVPEIVDRVSAQLAGQLVAGSHGRIDAVEGLLTRVASLICEKYYGVMMPSDVTDFGHWTIAMSTHIFVDATTTVPAHKRAAEAAAVQVRRLVMDSIAKAKRGGSPGTVMERLVQLQQRDGRLSDQVILSIVIGMITGFVPTNTLAAGNILDTLLSRPAFLEQARAAAVAGDDDLLRRCLFEALRFKHIHWGVTRICAEDYTIAARTGRATRVRKDQYVMASTWSAMFDERRVENPGAFDPNRRPADYMLFGYGLHWCVGAYIAQAQITQTFKALLLKDGLRRARGKDGQLRLLGFFPQHLFVEFDGRSAAVTSPN
jgi:cytochrome P450